ncbi:MAG: rRNA maturation RNase YbeY [Anaerolineales bacterium]|nr:rRNA maturation RNase YbeY [Anaerolineales bacterium]
MIHFYIESNYHQPGRTDLLNRAAELTLQDQQANPDYTFSLVLTGDEKLHELNLQFMGQDKPTDVLSFPSGDAEESLYLGDVIISVPRAQAQAEQRGHSLEQELQLLAVHGLLHLLGHDHATPQDKAQMWAAQGRVLQALYIPLEIVHEGEDD